MEIDAPPVENFWLRHCQNVLKTFEMAIRRAGDTNGIRERFLSLDLFLLQKLFHFLAFFRGGKGAIAPIRHRPHPPLAAASAARVLLAYCL